MLTWLRALFPHLYLSRTYLDSHTVPIQKGAIFLILSCQLVAEMRYEERN